MTAFKIPEIPTALEIEVKVKNEFKEFSKRQFSNGGFGYWYPYTPYARVSIFVTCHVGLCLAICKEKNVIFWRFIIFQKKKKKNFYSFFLYTKKIFFFFFN